MRAIRRSIGTLALGLFATLATSIVASGQTRLDTDATGAGVNSSCLPRSVLDASGNVHAVWQDFRAASPNAEWAIYYRKGTSYGSTWTPSDVRLSPTGSNAFDPRIATDGTNLIVAWRTTTSTTTAYADERVDAVVYNGTAGTWGSVTQMNSASLTDYASAPEVAANSNGNLYVVWAQAVGDLDHVFFRSYSLNTAPTGWNATPTQMSASTTTVRANWPRVAVGGVAGTTRRVYVAWIRSTTSSTTPYEVDFAASLDNGATFPSNRSAVLNNFTSPTVSTPVELSMAANTAGVVHVVWTDATAVSGQVTLQGKRNSSYGLTTSWAATPTRVDNATVTRNLAYEPSLVVDPGGNAYAAFAANVVNTTTHRNLANVFVTTALAPPATGWSSETQVSGVVQDLPELPQMRPKIAWASNGGSTTGTAIVWSQRANGNDRYAKLWIGTSKLGSAWSAAQVVSTSATTDPRQDFPDLFVRYVSGTAFQAGVVWDDRVNWSLPFTGFANGFGAPESYFRQVGF